MMNKPLAIVDKPFRAMKVNTSKERSFYTQGQQFAARVLFIVWLLASGSPESILATPKRQPAMTPAPTTSPQGPSLASVLPTPPSGGTLQLSPGSFWGSSVASSPAIDAALQQRMSQEAVPDKRRELLRTSPKVSPVEENRTFQARGGESVRFACQMGQWRAEVSSHIGDFSRQVVLPVVCSQGADVDSSLEVLSKYPSWYSQRQIHVLDRKVCPTLGEVVYVGALGLKGGNDEGEASGSGALQSKDPPQQGNGEPTTRPPSTSPAARSATSSSKGKALQTPYLASQTTGQPTTPQSLRDLPHSPSPKENEAYEQAYDHITFVDLARRSQGQGHLLRVVFQEQSSRQTNFTNQLTQLKILLNALDKSGALFDQSRRWSLPTEHVVWGHPHLIESGRPNPEPSILHSCIGHQAAKTSKSTIRLQCTHRAKKAIITH